MFNDGIKVSSSRRVFFGVARQYFCRRDVVMSYFFLRIFGVVLFVTWISSCRYPQITDGKLQLSTFKITHMNKKLLAKLNTNVPESYGRDALVVHIAKESAPVVAFGGVGQVVGEISHWQASETNTTVAVILPNYGFIDKWQKPETFAHFSFRLKHGTVHGKLYYLQRGEVSYFFVSSPSHIHDLWKSTHVEDVYNLPRRLFSKVELWSWRIFQFPGRTCCRFLSRRKFLIKNLSSHTFTGNECRCYVLFESFNEKFLSIIYTVHDYNAEPFVSYDLEKIFSYSKRSSYRNFRYFGKERKLMHCDTEEPRKMRTKSFRGKKISSSEFAFCADIITTVSKGMIGKSCKVWRICAPFYNLWVTWAFDKR